MSTNRNLRIFSVLLLCLTLLASVASAATITGTAYNLNLQVLDNTIFELHRGDGSIQRYVSTDGHYEFEVTSGNYQLIAKHESLVAVDPVTIGMNENIVHDLILIHDISDLERLIEESQESLLEPVDTTPTNTSLFIGAGIGTAILLALAIYTYKRHKSRQKTHQTRNSAHPPDQPTSKSHTTQDASSNVPNTNTHSPPPDISDNEENTLKEDVLAFIDQEGGRTTQKAIRKQFPYSEAKISLVVSELEHEGSVKKIKKGRSNIIIKNG